MSDRELKRLIELYLQAETDIINEIARLRSRGLADYHAEAALERVQAILHKLENDGWTYVPRMIEAQFYVHHPESRKALELPETPEKHLLGYKNARALTGEQLNIVQLLTTSAMATLTEANLTVTETLEEALLGRRRDDLFRRIGMERTALMQAAGQGVYKALPDFVVALRQDGVTAFIDKAGRKWNLHTYGSMVLRTTSRQAEVLSILTESPGHDLFQISKHGTTCPVCAPLEGRVYSKSGTDPDFPPLAAAFGKVDKNGPDTLKNSWLNLHPNCLHQLRRWTPMGRSEEEIQKVKDFSSFEKNPVTRDPRTQKQIDAYRKKEAARARFLRDYRQWERYRETIGGPVPKTFQTFRKHKAAGDEKYKAWESSYRKQNRVDNSEKRDTLGDTRYTAIPITDEAIERVPQIRPQGWSTGQAERLQEAHRDLLRTVQSKPVGTEAGAVYTMDMRLIEQRIGVEYQVSLPQTEGPHIIIHNHPSGLTFSEKDIEKFVLNFDTNILTAVGNNGQTYLLQKTDQYSPAGFVKAFGTILPQLHQAKTPQKYAEIINEFLERAIQYGTRFITRG